MITALRQQVHIFEKFDIKKISLPRKEYCITALALLTLTSLAAAWQIKKRFFSAKKILLTPQSPEPEPSEIVEETHRHESVPNDLFESQENVNLALGRIKKENFLASIREPNLDLNKVERKEQSIPLWAIEIYQLQSQRVILFSSIRNFNGNLNSVLLEKLKNSIEICNEQLLECIKTVENQILESEEIKAIQYEAGMHVSKNQERLKELENKFFEMVEAEVEKALKVANLLEWLAFDSEFFTLEIAEKIISKLSLTNGSFFLFFVRAIEKIEMQIRNNYGKYYKNFQYALQENNLRLSQMSGVPNFQKAILELKIKKMSSSLREIFVQNFEAVESANDQLIMKFRASENFDENNPFHKFLCKRINLESESRKEVEHWVGKIRDELTIQGQLLTLLGDANGLKKLLTREGVLYSSRDAVWMQLKICKGNKEILEVLFLNRKEQFFQALMLINPKNSEELEIVREIINQIGRGFWNDYSDYCGGDLRKVNQGITFRRLLQESSDSE